ncbi:TlpA family protein disulfide reductase [Capnocytophaga sp. G2]|jgi:AhpC/TSA family.|uniref:TlpA family protein disulfide reductase n=1 Tax=Capnocytophaga sp. G2 TaxID=3110695 RepID=UPI002B46F64D|nr:TlpA family protein disulfide reductase [Capnocytophaga sp. G2]MEB3004867.1 TlpA family protein disulfide reductase [Capnocytophaga sp. G2]
MKKRTILNLLLFAFVLSFFVTNLGYESQILLQRIFSSQVEILPQEKQYSIDPDWILKDKNNRQFSFTQSKGRVKFVYFFSSWRAMSIADLTGIQKLYDDYHNKIDFYIITNELPQPVEQKQQDRKFTFKVTYLIQEVKMPFDPEKIPSGYIINKEDKVVAQGFGNTRWNSNKVRKLLNNLISSSL